MSPDDAYRLETQLTTFELRFHRQCENAFRLAQFLTERHEQVLSVRYPGLPSHPTFKQASELFSKNGFGAMITFELQGGRQNCDIFVNSIRETVAYVPTLGDANSTLLHVSTVFGEDNYPQTGMIRFSVGCEPYKQLEEKISAALDNINV